MDREQISIRIQSNQIVSSSTREWMERLVDTIYNNFENNKFEKPFISKGKDLQKNINMYIDEDNTYEVCLRVIEKDNIVKEK